MPQLKPDSKIHPFIINPEEITVGSSQNCEKSFNEISECITSLVMMPNKEDKKDIIKVSNIQTIPPYRKDKKLFWEGFEGIQVLETINEHSFFAQSKNCQDFPIISLVQEKTKGGLPTSDIHLSQTLVTFNEWLNNQNKRENSLSRMSEKIAIDALTPSLIPNMASGKEPSQTSGQLSIPALRRFIASGYTYTYLFLKKSRKNERSYSISVVIDSTKRIFSSMNLLHSTYTIATFLGSLANIPDPENINVNVICCSHSQAQILLYNVPASSFQYPQIISDILATCYQNCRLHSGVGTGITVAYKLSLEQNSVDHKIFVFTDGVVTNISEIKELGIRLMQCESFNIQVIAIGLGICPYNIDSLFPISIHAIKFEAIGPALASVLGIYTNSSQTEIESIILTPSFKDTESALEKLLEKPSIYNPNLEDSIEHKPVSQEFLDKAGDIDIMFNNSESITENSIKEPYHPNTFWGFKILVVILYLGKPGSKDESIKPEVFESGCGEALKSKGFSYKLVYSYGEAINELKKNEEDQCPYCETWIFCSPGTGDLPPLAEDTDKNKIIPFLDAINDFWKSGGGLFIFSDNYPFTFEANLLLKKMWFIDKEKSGTTQLRFTGGYDNKDKTKAWIEVTDSELPGAGKFIKAAKMPAPGRCEKRWTLRPGLVKFFEGTTISTATDESGGHLSDDKLWPFKAFAWTTNPEGDPQPFIVYFDPPIPLDPNQNHTLGIKSPGPIVLHGGFTSAFAEFETGGTARLIISIACWLTRYEERCLNAERTSTILLTTVPALRNSYELPAGKTFNDWISLKSNEVDIIFCIDATGSMGSWIEAAKQKCHAISTFSRDKYPDLKFSFGAIFYRDPIDSSGDTNDYFQPTTSIDSLTSFMAGQTATGGGDGPEDWVGAFDILLHKITWRKGASRGIIHIADAPAHGKIWGGVDEHNDQGPLLLPHIKECAKNSIFYAAIDVGNYATPSFNAIKKIYQEEGNDKIYLYNKFDSSNSLDVGTFLENVATGLITAISAF